VGMTAGTLIGLCLGLAFGGVLRGKWLDHVLGPEVEDEPRTR
jgi:hypothetical protein